MSIAKPLTRSVSFTEPEHVTEVQIGRCKSMTYMYGLTLMDSFDQSEDALGIMLPFTFLYIGVFLVVLLIECSLANGKKKIIEIKLGT